MVAWKTLEHHPHFQANFL